MLVTYMTFAFKLSQAISFCISFWSEMHVKAGLCYIAGTEYDAAI